jgi:hypothetical protein
MNDIQKVIDNCFINPEKVAGGLLKRAKLAVFYRMKRLSIVLSRQFIKIFFPAIYKAQIEARREGGLSGDYQWLRLKEINDLIHKYSVSSVCEFGCGTSSLIFASLLKNRENFVTYDESGYWSKRMTDTAGNLSQWITAKVSERQVYRDAEGEVVTSYCDPIPGRFDLVYVDGPTNNTKGLDIEGKIWDPKGTIANVDVEKLLDRGDLPKLIVVDGRRSTVRRIIKKYGHLYSYRLKSEYHQGLGHIDLRYQYHSVFIRKN